MNIHKKMNKYTMIMKRFMKNYGVSWKNDHVIIDQKAENAKSVEK